MLEEVRQKKNTIKKAKLQQEWIRLFAKREKKYSFKFKTYQFE